MLEIQSYKDSLEELKYSKTIVSQSKPKNVRLNLIALKKLLEEDENILYILKNNLEVEIIKEPIQDNSLEKCYICADIWNNNKMTYNISKNYKTNLRRMYNLLCLLVHGNIEYIIIKLENEFPTDENIQNMIEKGIIPLCDYIIKELNDKKLEKENLMKDRRLIFNGATLKNLIFMGDGNTTGDITLTNNENKLSEEATKIITLGEEIITKLREVQTTTEEQAEEKRDLIANINNINTEVRKEQPESSVLRTNVRSILAIVNATILPLTTLGNNLHSFTQMIYSFVH